MSRAMYLPQQWRLVSGECARNRRAQWDIGAPLVSAAQHRRRRQWAYRVAAPPLRHQDGDDSMGRTPCRPAGVR